MHHAVAKTTLTKKIAIHTRKQETGADRLFCHPLRTWFRGRSITKCRSNIRQAADSHHVTARKPSRGRGQPTGRRVAALAKWRCRAAHRAQHRMGWSPVRVPPRTRRTDGATYGTIDRVEQGKREAGRIMGSGAGRNARRGVEASCTGREQSGSTARIEGQGLASSGGWPRPRSARSAEEGGGWPSRRQARLRWRCGSRRA